MRAGLVGGWDVLWFSRSNDGATVAYPNDGATVAYPNNGFA